MPWWKLRCTRQLGCRQCVSTPPLYVSCRSCMTSVSGRQAILPSSDVVHGVTSASERVRPVKRAFAYRNATATTTVTPSVGSTRMRVEAADATVALDRPVDTAQPNTTAVLRHEGLTAVASAYAARTQVLPRNAVISAPEGSDVTSEMVCNYLTMQQRLHQMQRSSSTVKSERYVVCDYMTFVLPRIVKRLGWNATLARVVLESAMTFRLHIPDVPLIHDAAAYLLSLAPTRDVTAVVAVDRTHVHKLTQTQLTECCVPVTLSSVTSRLTANGRFGLLLVQALRWQAAQTAFIRRIEDGSWNSYAANDTQPGLLPAAHTAAATGATRTTHTSVQPQDASATTSCLLTQYYTLRLLPDILDDLRVLCSSVRAEDAKISAAEHKAFSVALAACNKALAANALQVEAASPGLGTTAVQHRIHRPHFAIVDTRHDESHNTLRDHAAYDVVGMTATFAPLPLRDFVAFLSSFVANARRRSERHLRQITEKTARLRFATLDHNPRTAHDSSQDNCLQFSDPFHASSLLPVLHFVLHSHSFVRLLTHQVCHVTAVTSSAAAAVNVDDEVHDLPRVSSPDEVADTLPQEEARLVSQLIRDVVELFYMWQQWLPHSKSYHASAFSQLYVRALTYTATADGECSCNVVALSSHSGLLARIQAAVRRGVRAVLEGAEEMGETTGSCGASPEVGSVRLAVDVRRLRPVVVFGSLCECLARHMVRYNSADLTSQLRVMARLHDFIRRSDGAEDGGGEVAEAAMERCVTALDHHLSGFTLSLGVTRLGYRIGHLHYTLLNRNRQSARRAVTQKDDKDMRYTFVSSLMLTQLGFSNSSAPHLIAPTELVALVDAVEAMRIYPLRGLHRCALRIITDFPFLLGESSRCYSRLVCVAFRGTDLRTRSFTSATRQSRTMKYICSLVRIKALFSDELRSDLRRLAAGLPVVRVLDDGAAAVGVSGTTRPELLVDRFFLNNRFSTDHALTLDEVVELLLATVARNELDQLLHVSQLCMCCAARIVAAWPASAEFANGGATATAAAPPQLTRTQFCVRYLLPLYAASRSVWLNSRQRRNPVSNLKLLTLRKESGQSSRLSMLHTIVRVLHDVVGREAAGCCAALTATQDAAPHLSLDRAMEVASLLLHTTRREEGKAAVEERGESDRVGGTRSAAVHDDGAPVAPDIMALLQAVVQDAARQASAATMTRAFADFFDHASPVRWWSTCGVSGKDASSSALGDCGVTMATTNVLEQMRLSRCTTARTILRWICCASPAALASLPHAFLDALAMVGPGVSATMPDATEAHCHGESAGASSSLLAWALLPCSGAVAASPSLVPTLPRLQSFDALLWCTRQLYLTNPSFLAPVDATEGRATRGWGALQDDLYAHFTRLVTTSCAIDGLAEFLGLCALAEARQAAAQAPIVTSAPAGTSLLQRCVTFLLAGGVGPHRRELLTEMLQSASVTDTYAALHYMIHCFLLLHPFYAAHLPATSATRWSASPGVRAAEMPAALLAIPSVRAAVAEARQSKADAGLHPHLCSLVQFLTTFVSGVAPPRQPSDVTVMMKVVEFGRTRFPALQEIALQNICSYDATHQSRRDVIRGRNICMQADVNKALRTSLMVISAMQSSRTRLSARMSTQIMWRAVKAVTRYAGLVKPSYFPRASAELLSQLIESVSALRILRLAASIYLTMITSLENLHYTQSVLCADSVSSSVWPRRQLFQQIAQSGIVECSILPGSAVRLQYPPAVCQARGSFSGSLRDGAATDDEVKDADAMSVLMRWQFMRILAGLSDKAWDCLFAWRTIVERLVDMSVRHSLPAASRSRLSLVLQQRRGDKGEPAAVEQDRGTDATRIDEAVSAKPRSPTLTDRNYIVSRILRGLRIFSFLAYLTEAEVAEMYAWRGPLSFLNFVVTMTHNYALQTSELQRDNLHVWYTVLRDSTVAASQARRVYTGQGYLVPGPATATQSVLADAFLQSWLSKAWWVLEQLTTSDGLDKMLRAQMAADVARSRRERQNGCDEGDATGESHPAVRAARRYAMVREQRAEAAAKAGQSGAEYKKAADEDDTGDGDAEAEVGNTADEEEGAAVAGDGSNVATLDLQAIVHLLQLVDVLQPVLRARQCRVFAAKCGPYDEKFATARALYDSAELSVGISNDTDASRTLLSCGMLANVTPVQILQAVLSVVQDYTQLSTGGCTAPSPPGRPRLEVRSYSSVLKYHADRAHMEQQYDCVYGHGLPERNATTVQGDEEGSNLAKRRVAECQEKDRITARTRALRLGWEDIGSVHLAQAESCGAATVCAEQAALNAHVLRCVCTRPPDEVCSTPCVDTMPQTRRQFAQFQSHDLCCLILLLAERLVRGGTANDAGAIALHTRAAVEGEVECRYEIQQHLTALLDAFTELLPSVTAKDLLSVTEALLPILRQAPLCDHTSRDVACRDDFAKDTCDLSANELGEVLRHAIRRLLAHIPGLVAHDIERFTRQQLFRLLYHLHAPQRRLHASSDGAAPDLNCLFAESFVAPEAARAVHHAYLAFYNNQRRRRNDDGKVCDDDKSAERAGTPADGADANDLSGFEMAFDEFMGETEEETGGKTTTDAISEDIGQQWQEFTRYIERNVGSCPHDLLIKLLDVIETTSMHTDRQPAT